RRARSPGGRDRAAAPGDPGGSLGLELCPPGQARPHSPSFQVSLLPMLPRRRAPQASHRPRAHRDRRPARSAPLVRAFALALAVPVFLLVSLLLVSLGGRAASAAPFDMKGDDWEGLTPLLR